MTNQSPADLTWERKEGGSLDRSNEPKDIQYSMYHNYYNLLY